MLHWKDNKVVTVASTYCSTTPISKAKQFSQADSQKMKYNSYKWSKYVPMCMGEVDLLDLNLAAYMVNHQSKKIVVSCLPLFPPL